MQTQHGASNGDTIAVGANAWCSGGANAVGDQGCQAFAGNALQANTDFTGTITGIASNVITYSGGTNEGQRGEAGTTTGTSGYVIDLSRAYTTGTISSITGTPPVVVGSGTTRTSLSGQYCFVLTNGNTQGTGKYMIPVQTITDNTHITLNYLNIGVQSAWQGDASTGNYSLYPCSTVPAGGVQQTGQITVTSSANFQNGDSIEEPPSASEFGEAMQLNVRQTIPSAVGWAGFTIGNLGPRTIPTAIVVNGNWTSGFSFNGNTVAEFYGQAEVDLLRWLMSRPDAMTALQQYQKTHQRALQGKRKPLEAAPDVIDPSWRQRPERRMSAEDLIRSQFSGKSLERELRRLL